MTSLSPRLNRPISTAELQRRWTAVRTAMGHAGLDVLLMQNNSDVNGGYVRWFTDMPTNHNPTTIVFPREGAMTAVIHGPSGARSIGPEGDGILRGVERVFGTASFASAHYTRHDDARLIAPALEPYSRGSIGLVGTYQLSYAMGSFIAERFPDARLQEASDLVDSIKAIKSAEEQVLIYETASLQDELMALAFAAIEPGKRESDITALVRGAAQERGSEAGVILCGSAPLGDPAPIAGTHFQHRVIEAGDLLALLVEVDGPGGQYAELGRMCSVGAAPAQAKEELAIVLAAQRHTVSQLIPGAHCADIFEAHNQFLSEHGRPPEGRIYGHGQGYDLVERPLLRFDETMPLEAGMNIACHPSYLANGVFAWVCDNWMIGPDGPSERVHVFPQEMVEL
jgi:Xaa-Pro aminopeptidase